MDTPTVTVEGEGGRGGRGRERREREGGGSSRVEYERERSSWWHTTGDRILSGGRCRERISRTCGEWSQSVVIATGLVILLQ